MLEQKRPLSDGLLDGYASYRWELPDGQKTNLHVLRKRIDQTAVEVVRRQKATRLPVLCKEINNGQVLAAMSGGFLDRENDQPLGELWIAGERQPHTPFVKPWADVRGALLVDENGITIDWRDNLPAQPERTLLQAGPVVVFDGRPVTDDREGFSSGSGQFDSDITKGRYPRAAIGYSDLYYYGVVVDGRADGHADDLGMTLTELAEFMTDELGVKAALNLDGGGSATMVTLLDDEFTVMNSPMDDYMKPSPGGSRPLYSALVFSKKDQTAR